MNLKMDIELSVEPENSVFYCRKAISNDTVFKCYTVLEPVLDEGRCGYSFYLSMQSGKDFEEAVISDLTRDLTCAEKFFSTLCCYTVFPCHLVDVAEDFLALI